MKRELLICRYDYWPSLTPDKIRELDYTQWPHLAIACDSLSEQRERDAEEMKRKAR